MPAYRPPLSPYTLRFYDDALEQAYEEEYVEASLSIVRVTLILGALLYAAYGFLDHLLVPDAEETLWVIRFPVVLLILGVFALTYVEHLRPYHNLVMSALIVVAGVDVAIMMWHWPDELGYIYVTGLMMIFMYAHGHLRMRFLYATISTSIVVGVYGLIVPSATFVRTGPILGGAVVLCMFASYAIEFYDRKSFWHNKILQEQRRQLEREHERKTQELEAVRRLQLSLLPQVVPDCGPAEIAVAMRPAVEIGGDYYDFDTDPQGATTFAIGDATGHGAEAGAMVTATKILFATLSREPRISDILARASSTLKRVGINKLFMAMAVGRLRGSELQLAGAGMPPALIYRAATGLCEEIPLKGMPLGTFGDYPYRTTVVQLHPNDRLVLMSDGFPEAFSEEGEMLGYERACEIVQTVAHLDPPELINALMQQAQAWCGRRPIRDDITFMVLRASVKAAERSDTPSQEVHERSTSLPAGRPSALSPV